MREGFWSEHNQVVITMIDIIWIFLVKFPTKSKTLSQYQEPIWNMNINWNQPHLKMCFQIIAHYFHEIWILEWLYGKVAAHLITRTITQTLSCSLSLSLKPIYHANFIIFYSKKINGNDIRLLLADLFLVSLHPTKLFRLEWFVI